MRIPILVACLSVSSMAAANEGMWPPQQLPEIEAALRETGLVLEPEALADLTAHPMGAIVSLGGCTASFVSPQGLTVTNHHCAYGAIQLNSSPERNLLEDGFSAATLADEVSAGPAARIYVTEAIQDVTARVLAAATPDMDDRARYDAIDAATQHVNHSPARLAPARRPNCVQIVTSEAEDGEDAAKRLRLPRACP